MLNATTKWSKKEEINSIEYHINWITNEVLKDRIRDNLIWVISKAWKYLICTNVSKISTILLNASIPIIMALARNTSKYNLAVTIISSALLVITSASTTLKFQELWKQFRIVSENYKSECIKAYMSIDNYNNLSQDEKEKMLCNKLEVYFKDCLNNWEKIYEKI